MGLIHSFQLRKLAALLDDPDPTRRIAAVDGIAEIGGEEAVHLLLGALTAPANDGLVRSRIVAALGTLKAREAVPSLLRILRDTRTENRIARRRAVEALGAIGDPVAVRPMLEVLCVEGGEDGELSSRIRESLHEMAKHSILPFMEVLGSPEACHRIEAICVLGKFGGDDIHQLLRKALTDRHYRVRIEAASALGRHGSLEDVGVLSAALKDVNRDVREAAKRAILEIRGRFERKSSSRTTGDRSGG